MDLEECIHYSDPVNANLHVVIPGKLLFMANPVDLPDDRHWMDIGPARSFSPAFYADLLDEFGVVLVICLDECDYDRAPFEERGMGCEELRLRPDSADILRAADRFLCLLAAAPGAVAIHGGDAGALCAGTLVSAHLMARLGFGAGDAAAWLRMACPALLVPPDYLAALHAHSAELRAAGSADAASALLRCLSSPHGLIGAAGGGGGGGGVAHLVLERAFSLPDVIL